jgi:hypothetical protein
MPRRLRSEDDINDANEHVFRGMDKRLVGPRMGAAMTSSLRLADSINIRSKDRYQRMLIQAQKAGVEIPTDFMKEKLGIPNGGERRPGKKSLKAARK